MSSLKFFTIVLLVAVVASSTLFNVAEAKGAVTAVVTVVTAVVAVVVSPVTAVAVAVGAAVAGGAKKVVEGIKEGVEAVKEWVAGVKETVEEIKAVAKSIKEKKKEIDAKVAEIKSAIAKFKDLKEKGLLSSVGEENIKNLLDVYQQTFLNRLQAFVAAKTSIEQETIKKEIGNLLDVPLLLALEKAATAPKFTLTADDLLKGRLLEVISPAPVVKTAEEILAERCIGDIKKISGKITEINSAQNYLIIETKWPIEKTYKLLITSATQIKDVLLPGRVIDPKKRITLAGFRVGDLLEADIKEDICEVIKTTVDSLSALFIQPVRW